MQESRDGHGFMGDFMDVSLVLHVAFVLVRFGTHDVESR